MSEAKNESSANGATSSELLYLARQRKLMRMTDEELTRLNEKLIGRGYQFATKERIQVCEEKGRRMAKWFADNCEI